jgi:hypothetical protein
MGIYPGSKRLICSKIRNEMYLHFKKSSGMEDLPGCSGSKTRTFVKKRIDSDHTNRNITGG